MGTTADGAGAQGNARERESERAREGAGKGAGHRVLGPALRRKSRPTTPGGCKAPLTKTNGASCTSRWGPIDKPSIEQKPADPIWHTGRPVELELTAAGQGSDEAKRLGGQCPLLLKPRGGSDLEALR